MQRSVFCFFLQYGKLGRAWEQGYQLYSLNINGLGMYVNMLTQKKNQINNLMLYIDVSLQLVRTFS